MAEKIVSPGVFTRENDLSFIQAGVAAIGGAIVGPTAKGPVLIPTPVNSYQQYVELFGDAYESGSRTYQFFTSIAAKEYLKHNSPLTVVRVMGDTYSNASSSWDTTNKNPGVPSTGSSDGTATAVASGSSGSVTITAISDGDKFYVTSSAGDIYTFIAADAPIPDDITSAKTWFFADTGTLNDDIAELATNINTNVPLLTCTAATAVLNFTSSATAGASSNGVSFESGSTQLDLSGGVDPLSGFTKSFEIYTRGHGANLNSECVETTNHVLPSGSKHNLRWEITGANKAKGTFNLLIRRGNDSSKRKSIIETFNGLTMDPNDANYVGLRVGTQYSVVSGDATQGYYLQPTGTYPNRSNFIYILETSITNIANYLDENGTITSDAVALTGSAFPKDSSGSFAGGADDYEHPMKWYNEITSDNVQGVDPTTAADGKNAYEKAFSLLANPDEFDINILSAPGLYRADHSTLIDTYMIENCEKRGDVIAVVDPVKYNMGITDATAQSAAVDSSYGAMYWPWVQIQDTMTGGYIWVPQSTLIPSIYAFNDKVAHEWFAPAGLNRGGLETAVQAERKLTHANRDTLYEENVNPIATFPGEGVVVFGQKTLQKKASALDRVNVRRLLINLKKFIAGVSKFLVFENNTAVTRNRFLSQVEPYMKNVQNQQGLYAFKVQMDELNNTPDVIDRNQMKGAIFLQPAKAAEFIIIDFNIMPTGATFDD